VNTITIKQTFSIETCCTCGVPFGIESDHQRHLRNTGASFYCPNGHKQHYTDTQDEKIRRLEQRLAAEAGNRRHLNEQFERERRRHAATKGQLTKTRKRVSGGVCPCCNRSFVDLARHMAGQHPDYVTRT